LALMYEARPLDESQKENIFNALSAELMKIYSAFDLLDKRDGQDEVFNIIDNILRLGMPHAAATALDLEKYKNCNDRIGDNND